MYTVQKQQAQKATSSEYVQTKMAQLKSLEQELQKKTLSVAEQIKQSEANLLAHEKAISQQQQVLLSPLPPESYVLNQSPHPTVSKCQCPINSLVSII